MTHRPSAFDTPYEVVKPTRFQYLSPQTPDGLLHGDGMLEIGEVVWTHRSLPPVKGHHRALAFIDQAGEVLVEIGSLHRKGDVPESTPKHQPQL